jgi:hypothetical protein
MPIAAVSELTFSVSALLAFQRLAEIAILPAHLRIRPQLLQISDTTVPISDEEHEILTAAGLLTAEGPDADAVMILRALSSPDSEINVTLGAPGRADTYVCLARRHQLLISAARCVDDVTIDAYTMVNESELVGVVADTVRSYLFGKDPGEGAAVERTSFPLSMVYDTMCAEDPIDWAASLQAQGIPRALAAVLYRSEVSMDGRAEVAAYLNHEGVRSAPDTVLRVTSMPDGAIMTSFASDNNQQRWLTVEPYESGRLERAIAEAIRSVPGESWFTHSRTD